MNPSDISLTIGLRPTVLVIDDSRVMRKAISKILAGEFEMVEAEDGETGWQQLTSHPEIEVVISDIEMPGLDGFELLTRLRNFEDVRISTMPVIIITATEDEETRQAALDKGATDFITKPIDRTQLLARTRALARYTETTRDLEETAITLKSETTHDPLTGLNSRRFFLQRGEQDIAYSRRHNQDMALLRVDIDKFRRLYTEYGDEIVDDVLIWIAQSLKSCARIEDTLSRIGGSSFALMAPSVTLGEAMILSGRLRNAISTRPFAKGNLVIPMTASVGLAMRNNQSDCDIDSLLKIANNNLRKARRSGGNAVHTEGGPDIEALPTIEAEETTTSLPELDSLETIGAGIEEIVASAPEELMFDSGATIVDKIEIPALNEAMELLDSGQLTELEPHLWPLLKRLLPLLEYCNKKLGLGIGVATKVIRHKIDNPEEE